MLAMACSGYYCGFHQKKKAKGIVPKCGTAILIKVLPKIGRKKGN